jgi:hypothetical protein
MPGKPILVGVRESPESKVTVSIAIHNVYSVYYYLLFPNGPDSADSQFTDTYYDFVVEQGSIQLEQNQDKDA